MIRLAKKIFLCLLLTFLAMSVARAQILNSVNVIPPSEWVKNGISNVRFINRNEDAGEVRIMAGRKVLLTITARGQIIPCKQAASNQVCNKNLVQSRNITFLRLADDRVALLLFS